MGLFDSVHTGTRCGRTKALGRSMADYTIGDAGLHLFPVPAPVERSTFEEFLARLEREPVADTFAVMMDTGGLLVVTETVLVDWVAHVDGVPAGHPVVTELGLPAARPLAVDELAARRRAASARTAGIGARDCSACTIIRTRGRDAYAAIRNDARAVARSEARNAPYSQDRSPQRGPVRSLGRLPAPGSVMSATTVPAQHVAVRRLPPWLEQTSPSRSSQRSTD